MSEPARLHDGLREPETLEQANEWIETLRRAYHRESDYRQRLEHDVSILREATDTVLFQKGLTIGTARRILRIASTGCHFGLSRPYELRPIPEHTLRMGADLVLRLTGKES